MTAWLGLDIGGANLKAARLAQGRWTTAAIPFALWQAPETLDTQLKTLADRLGHFDRLLITTTAELCDCFASKRQGITHVIRAAERLAAGRAVRVWLTSGQFVSAQQAIEQPLGAAAANWHALASDVARQWPIGQTLLMDIGSTTSDLIPLAGGRVCARGLTDFDRLASGELVYLGMSRTPVMALGPSVTLAGKTFGVMAEWFATTADVYLLLGRTPEQPDDCQTPDGQPMTRLAAARRLVRMIGHDLETFSFKQALALARAFDQQLRRRLTQAAARQPAPDRVVVSGSGADLAAAVLQDLFPQAECIDLRDLPGQVGCGAACAAALIRLEANRP